MVSVTFPFIGNRHALFDTGSPVSFIRISYVPAEMLNGAFVYLKCRELGDSKIYTYGIVKLKLFFNCKKTILPIFVFLDQMLPTALLLGRDFLSLYLKWTCDNELLPSPLMRRKHININELLSIRKRSIGMKITCFQREC